MLCKYVITYVRNFYYEERSIAPFTVCVLIIYAIVLAIYLKHF